MDDDYFNCIYFSDNVLLGNIINTSVVADEFECHQKCLGNISCKSFNVHPGADITKHVCELNNKTRQMKPDDFIAKSGSSYYGQVKVRLRGDKTEHGGVIFRFLLEMIMLKDFIHKV